MIDDFISLFQRVKKFNDANDNAILNIEILGEMATALRSRFDIFESSYKYLLKTDEINFCGVIIHVSENRGGKK